MDHHRPSTQQNKNPGQLLVSKSTLNVNLYLEYKVLALHAVKLSYAFHDLYTWSHFSKSDVHVHRRVKRRSPEFWSCCYFAKLNWGKTSFAIPGIDCPSITLSERSALRDHGADRLQ